MDSVQRLHVNLLKRRTSIRNHKSTLQWMKRCWRVVPHEDPELLSVDEYEVTYATLLYEMTICWEDDTSDVVLAKMWQRDASYFGNLNFDRFCCSLFCFVEMVSSFHPAPHLLHADTDREFVVSTVWNMHSGSKTSAKRHMNEPSRWSTPSCAATTARWARKRPPRPSSRRSRA